MIDKPMKYIVISKVELCPMRDCQDEDLNV
jgi:hypothetical protein